MKEDTSWFKQSFSLNLNNVNITQLVGGWARWAIYNHLLLCPVRKRDTPRQFQ